MNIPHSIILGLIQGLTEFLPISSSGHLVIMPWLFGWEKHPLIFDIILHFGTFCAIIIYFRREWIGILRFKDPVGRKLFWCIVIASLPGIVFGSIFGKGIEDYFRNPMSVALALGIFGAVLYISQIYGRENKSLAEITLLTALLIGFSQMFAIIPGVSRAGITISAALVLGMNRESSVRFSFLLGAPIIFAATCYGIGGLISQNLFALGGSAFGGSAGGLENFLSWPAVLTGLAVAFLSSMIAIHFLLRYVKKHPFTAFVVYRLVLSLFIVIMLFRI